MQRLLVIRGGAVGDFVLTLPAIGALRQAFPQAHIEVWGHPRRAVLALHPRYASHVSDLEAWDLFRLFSRQGRASARLIQALERVDAVLAYMASADGVFAERLQASCPGRVVVWPPQPLAPQHATDHLLQPVGAIRPGRYDPVPRVFLTPEANAAAARFWHDHGVPDAGVVALHPGSGGASKLWPVSGWQQLAVWMARQGIPGVLVSGPADHERVRRLVQGVHLPPWPCVGEMPLSHLAAILARCRVLVGHDSGITHLAAAVGTPTLALFGPTDPHVWGPRSRRACVLQPETPGPLDLATMPPAAVIDTLHALWQGTFDFAPSPLDYTPQRVRRETG